MKSRKQQLTDRSFTYAYGTTRDRLCGDSAEGNLKAGAWKDGYKAAMRDVRKIVADCYKEAAETFGPNPPNPVKRIQHRNHCVRVRVERFLRPIR